MTGRAHPAANPELDALLEQDAYDDLRREGGPSFDGRQPVNPPLPDGSPVEDPMSTPVEAGQTRQGASIEDLDDIDAALSWLADVRTCARLLAQATPSAPSVLTVARTRRLALEVARLAGDGEYAPFDRDPTPGGTT